jgi:copper ion binding protein
MNSKNSSTKSAGAGLLVAITASLCCITPVLALISGVGGIAASFSWLEPLRPFMIGLTIAVLGFAWYQLLKPKPADVDCGCEPSEEAKTPFMQTKLFLGMVTVFATLMLAFPHYSSIFYPEVTKNIVATDAYEVRQIKLEVEGMTCTSCEDHINHEVSKLSGVYEVKASYENGNTVVKFDPEKISKEEIVKAINGTGYTVKENTNSTGN